jgi:hypothetical protein
MTLAWMTRQLVSFPVAGSAGSARQATPNPRPPGAIQPGSVSEAVLSHLREHPKRWHRTHEIVKAVARSQKTVSWALHFLRALGHIEATACGGPSTPCRYLKYRASPAPTGGGLPRSGTERAGLREGIREKPLTAPEATTNQGVLHATTGKD